MPFATSGETTAEKEKELDVIADDANPLTANDLFIPAAAGLTALYFLLEGNLFIISIIALSALVAYSVWCSGSQEKRVLSPSF